MVCYLWSRWFWAIGGKLFAVIIQSDYRTCPAHWNIILQTLDLKSTGVACQNIGHVETLKHIYLERPDDIKNSHEFITDTFILSLGVKKCRMLETLVVRNYPRVTDASLVHAEKCLLSLKYLDLSGSRCSAKQAAIFRKNRPKVSLIL